MKTQFWQVNGNSDTEKIQQAAQLLQQGEVISFPTETVYGLGADATNEVAVSKIFKAKGRPSDNPLIVHIADASMLEELVVTIPDYVEKLIEKFSPGPITYILRSKGTVASNVTAGLATVAVRIPNHRVALALLRASRLALAAPSANLSGRPSPTTSDHVMDDLAGRIAGVIDGGSATVGVESTVVDCTGKLPVILRLGSITAEDIREVVGHAEVYELPATDKLKPRSPGLKYKHYAPAMPLILVPGNREDLQAVINKKRAKGQRVGLLAARSTAVNMEADQVVELGADLQEIAANLYHALRQFKREAIDIIICEMFVEEGMGQVIMDRLIRASDQVYEG